MVTEVKMFFETSVTTQRLSVTSQKTRILTISLWEPEFCQQREHPKTCAW